MHRVCIFAASRNGGARYLSAATAVIPSNIEAQARAVRFGDDLETMLDALAP